MDTPVKINYNNNEDLEVAWQFIANTDKSVFLTGKAGTGKTTFLKRILELSPKRKVVVAPTGVAAINAQGVTIHSFFQLPFSPYIPGTTYIEDRNKRYKFSKEKKQILKTLDLVIIDEISMVRCDLLDAIDNVLRNYKNRDLPFGGVQLLLIGDLYQLAPIAVEKEWNMLKEYYDTPYFFSSMALQQIDYVTIELKQIYRQTDDQFIGILNKIRENCLDQASIDILNSRVDTNALNPNYFSAQNDDNSEDKAEPIRLTTHNNTSNNYNQSKLDAINKPIHTFEATIIDNFPESAYPAEKLLSLKVGAQVMFIKNDTSSGKHLYYNGKIGVIIDIVKDSVIVKCPEDEESILVTQETWENTRYVIDEETKEIKTEVEGEFRQIPLRLAWAITIHKSQGLTFNQAVVDINNSFTHGQVYVAISRCRSLEGLKLTQPINPLSIINDRSINTFIDTNISLSENSKQKLPVIEQEYFVKLIDELFDFNEITGNINYVYRILQEHLYKKHEELINQCTETIAALDQKIIQVASTFKKQYCNIIRTSEDVRTDERLQERIQKGAEYFATQVHEIFDTLLKDIKIDITNKTIAKQYKGATDNLTESIHFKSALLESIQEHGFSIQTYLNDKALCLLNDTPQKKKKAKKVKEPKISTQEITLRLIREGKSIKEIADIRNLGVSTIENHLVALITKDEIDVKEFVDKDKQNKIKIAVIKYGLDAPLSQIKESLPSTISYGDIKIVLADIKKQI